MKKILLSILALVSASALAGVVPTSPSVTVGTLPDPSTLDASQFNKYDGSVYIRTSTGTAYTPGESAAYDITTATLSVTKLRDDFGVALSVAYEATPIGDIQSIVSLSQPLLGENDVVWGACSYNAIKDTSSRLYLNGSDRFFIEQVI